ncbi:MAG TPA: FtsX-like permease family protein [Acidimicrobiales bacterium]|jgi:putative ABC transport system permease protein|nr:FtsX-like permease family protein [Acidimicrobiales bacterium]
MTTSSHGLASERDNGGLPARRAVTRWAWRLLRREWRQQILILALITVAVAATTVGVGVSSNTPLSTYVGFGNAKDLATFSNDGASTKAKIASWHSRYGEVDVIENQIISVPGSIDTFDLRSENPNDSYGKPLLSLVSGELPTKANEVALTSGVASELNLKVGGAWGNGGVTREVVGIVENPENLLDQFALVIPGQVARPSQVSVLFDASGTAPSKLGASVISTQSVGSGNVLNPETITLALVTMVMLLIALVSIAGFTVLAQRRLRSIGMLGALGATDKDIMLVVRANGFFVGLMGAIFGLILGLGAWLAYRPTLETSAHHVVGVFQLPWAVVIAAVVLAVAAAYFASTRPARAMTRISTVMALAGRPQAPKKLHRSAVPGVILLVVAFVVMGYAGSSGGNGGGAGELVLAFVLLTVAVVLLAPFLLSALDRFTRHAPLAIRMAMRDLARYRARSGAALGAISVAVLIAMVVIIASAARFGNVLDYAGPNLSSTQLIVYTPNGPYGAGGPGNQNAGSGAPAGSIASMSTSAHALARSLGSHDVITLESTSASIQHAAAGRSYSGPLYVATPKLLKAFGIKTSTIDPTADILTMRPGFASINKMQIVYGNYFGPGGKIGPNEWPCPKSDCLANPSMQEVTSLPAGTSAPNTVITEYAVHQLGLTADTAGWLIQTPQPLSAAQLTNARATAAAAGMSIESKSSIPTSATIIDWATIVGIVLALGILAMTIGLIRSETAGELRILVATGASSRTRRSLTAATAGALAFIGAVVGTAAAYIALIGFSRTNALDGLSSLASVPVLNLLLILLAMPAAAAIVAWLAAWREPSGVSRQLVA